MGRPVPGAPPHPWKICVWASGMNSTITPNEDARYKGGKVYPASVTPAYPQGEELDGAVGWDWGIKFSDFEDLINQLKGNPPDHICGRRSSLPAQTPYWGVDKCDKLKDGELYSIAIDTHGTDGVVDIDNTGNLKTGLDADRLVTVYSAQMTSLATLLHPNGFVMFTGCQSGRGTAGDNLLLAVSKALPGREITAFTKIGLSLSTHQMRTPGPNPPRDPDDLNEPGSRVTSHADWNGGSGKEEADWIARDADGHLTCPWASSKAKHAKVCLNQKFWGPGVGDFDSW
jgi:hypothetical protein